MDAVMYQIYPRSFCDTSGTGVGDLDGVRRHLDHLSWLGVDGLWLSPIFPSPMADHGYDVADYCDVDPLFGGMAALDALVAESHERGLRVLLDWVPNHSSDQHPWFLESRSSRDNPRRDWYIWVDGTPDEPPTKWKATFPPGTPAWTWDDTTQAWYHHRFAPQQPDLDWSNPAVEAAMLDTLRFWLDRGVDGFRMDVIHMIGKDLSRIGPDYGDATDPVRTHGHLRRIRAVLDAYDGDRVSVGEVYILDVEQVAEYIGAGPEGPELHLGFDFVPLFLEWAADPWRTHLAQAEAALGRRGSWPTWALSSHDITRVRSRLGSEEKARAAAVLLLGLRGTPFLYAGEELGLEDATVPPELRVDPAGFRDGCRAPIPWDASPHHGWAGATPWLPWPPDPDVRNAASLRDDPASIVHLYRRLLAARRASAALRAGDVTFLPAGDPDNDDVLVLERRAPDGDRRLVALNFAPTPRPFTPPAGPWTVEISSTGAGEGAPFPNELAPDEAVLLRP
jgi:alpha-glucosidase